MSAESIFKNKCIYIHAEHKSAKKEGTDMILERKRQNIAYFFLHAVFMYAHEHVFMYMCIYVQAHAYVCMCVIWKHKERGEYRNIKSGREVVERVLTDKFGQIIQ